MVMSIAHGSNDVANTVGPWAAVYQTYLAGEVATRSPTPVWFLVVAGLLLGLGFWFYGYHIVRALGNKVTQMLAENVAQAGTLLVGLTFKDRTGPSVFPLAPVQVVWIVMATLGLPDMGLGFERAVPDILQRPPQSLKTGILTLEFLVDMVVYGLWITLLCLASFVLVVFGFGDGELGEGCNQTCSDQCNLFVLFLAWEMIDMRRSFFHMQPGSKRYFTQWRLHVWMNQFLFEAIIISFVLLFLLIYIPVLNTVVFKHAPIDWEWGIVFIETGIFFVGIKFWKWCKRVYFRCKGAKHGTRKVDKNMEIEDCVFGRYYSCDSSSTGNESVREKT
ncbi:hypothetical protein G6011_06396 [Alternaria panax]|uniref:Cation-transporting P-type ATPase C-terminal domain-containing protein n=1 Tax=Alternaria panax TaxID=48097 RepID=A0AAD4FID9_9PLEO|nr:hypothetical protein G6011_06396 [Alternaria panax]